MNDRTGSPRHCCKHCGWELLYHWQYWPRIPEHMGDCPGYEPLYHWQYWPRIPEHMGDCPGYEPLPLPSLKECGCSACEEAAERCAE